jgi:hypothetical protein
MSLATHERDADRVRRHTNEAVVQSIEEETRRNVARYGRAPAGIHQRLRTLEREWDVERTLEANAATLAFSGAVLGTTVNKQWFWLTGGVLGFLFQHAVSGWCPPLPVLRRLGVRTQNEIDREKYALKAVRGDLAQGRDSGDEALAAVAHSEPADTARRERDPDRVRRYTSATQLRKLDGEMAKRIRLYTGQPREVITQRIEELRREWSIERYLQINVAAVGLTAVGLAVWRDRRWGYAACAGLAFFLFHAVEGFDPPLPAMRKAGLRSRAEINREIYALKILRGDFEGTGTEEDRVEAALRAVAE